MLTISPLLLVLPHLGSNLSKHLPAVSVQGSALLRLLHDVIAQSETRVPVALHLSTVDTVGDVSWTADATHVRRDLLHSAAGLWKLGCSRVLQ